MRRVKITPYLESFGLTQEDLDWMVEHEGLTTNQGGWNECARESVIEHMTQRNPMWTEGVAQKAIQTKLDRYGTTFLRCPITDEEKESLSKRMKENNPLTNQPEKNWTAYPITVEFEDGTVETFPYVKALSKTKGIPYPTLKCMIRDDRGSKKHKIVRIKKLLSEG